MNVAPLMTRNVIRVNMDTSLVKIRAIFEKHKFHHLVVMEGGKLIGVLSDRDLLREISPFIDTASEKSRDAGTLAKKAHQIMSRNPITISSKCTVEEASELLLQHNISCLPVLSANEELEGILTLKDLVKYYLRNDSETKVPESEFDLGSEDNINKEGDER